MKFLKPMFGILGLSLMFSCSSDDSNQNRADVPKSKLEIKAFSTSSPKSASGAKSASNVEITKFLINIKEIEFEFADGFGIPSSSSGSSRDDDDISFEELPAAILAYLEENYPNDPFCKGELEDDNDDPYKYKIELQSGTGLYFRENFSIYAIDPDNDGCDDNDDDDNDDRYDTDDEFELKGPFELNLTSDVVTVIQVEIPVGEYEEIEFEMDRSNDPNSELYQKSILIKGTISGTPFEFYHTFSEDFEVDYEDSGRNLVITENNNNTVVFEFDLVSVFNVVDLSTAQDGNGNGIIEINPVDNDGNRQLANRIKNVIKDYVDLLDD